MNATVVIKKNLKTITWKYIKKLTINQENCISVIIVTKKKWEVEPVDENDDADNESGENEVEACDFCCEMFDEIEDLIDHYGTTGHFI